MSQLLIHNFLADLDRLRAVSGTTRETVVREAFKDLLKAWARQHELVFIAEYPFQTAAKEDRAVDGALLYSLRVPLGYWEAKDENDDLDAEIEYKKRRGYPQTNIIFEDSQNAVLIQNRHEVARASIADTKALERLLNLFFTYERSGLEGCVRVARSLDHFEELLLQRVKLLGDVVLAGFCQNASRTATRRSRS